MAETGPKQHEQGDGSLQHRPRFKKQEHSKPDGKSRFKNGKTSRQAVQSVAVARREEIPLRQVHVFVRSMVWFFGGFLTDQDQRQLREEIELDLVLSCRFFGLRADVRSILGFVDLENGFGPFLAARCHRCGRRKPILSPSVAAFVVDSHDVGHRSVVALAIDRRRPVEARDKTVSGCSLSTACAGVRVINCLFMFVINYLIKFVFI